jgi:hypothetical protein
MTAKSTQHLLSARPFACGGKVHRSTVVDTAHARQGTKFFPANAQRAAAFIVIVVPEALGDRPRAFTLRIATGGTTRLRPAASSLRLCAQGV